RLDLDEHERRPIPGDEVDLAEARADVPLEDREAAALEKPSRHLLTELTERTGRRLAHRPRRSKRLTNAALAECAARRGDARAAEIRTVSAERRGGRWRTREEGQPD